MSSAQQRIQKLRDELNRHNFLYYVQDKSEISDREFDRLMHELVDLEKQHPELASPDSPTQRVGGEPIGAFQTVEHAVRMASIDNTYSEEEVRDFDKRVRKGLKEGEGEKIRYVAEPKVDGVSLNLRYEKGILLRAATRGDGRRGDDITVNARTIRSIPLRLHGACPDVVEIRGEVYMNNADFQKLNQQRQAAGEELFANPRNFTAGTLKQLDPKIVASRNLRFVSHSLGQVEPVPTDSYWQWLKIAAKLGVPISEHAKILESVEELLEYIHDFAKLRGDLPYQTDGVVIKLDSFSQREALGETSRAPRWEIAFKYPAEQVQTVLNDVIWQVGKLGTLTPVAVLEPVFVAGTTVSRASLHNIDQIHRLDVHLGDTVVVEKAGEIIPQVVQVVLSKRPAHAKKVNPPQKCPACSTPVEKEADGPFLRCVNPACPAQRKERLHWFCARKQMNIEHLGEALIDQLVDHGLVETFADIYKLKMDQLVNLERMAEKSARNVIDSIEASRSRGLDHLLSGLGIRHVGTRVAFLLAEHFGSLDALAAASVQQLSAIHDIGEAIAQSVHDFFHNPAGRDAVQALQAVGIDPKWEKSAASDGGEGGTATLPLAGQSIVVTGTLEKFTRQEIEEWIAKLGGRPAASVSKKTSFLIAGADAGSKLQKAKELGIPVLSEQEFIEKTGAQR